MTSSPGDAPPASSGELGLARAALAPLEWDSEFFGFPIGRVALDGLGGEEIAHIETLARSSGMACLYGFLDPKHYELSYLVQTMGYRFVEASARFDLAPGVDVDYPPTDTVVRRGTEEDLPAITDAVLRMASWSRFAVDPRFGLDAARRMNLAWVDRAARCRTDDYALTVAEGAAGITAFMTRARHPHPFADSVGTTAPGTGAARALMRDACEWAGGDGLWCGWAAARNVNSYRFVENCGFRVAGVRYIFHRWLDEEPR